MRFTIPKSTDFKKVVQVLTKISDEVPLKVTHEGLTCRVLSEDKTTLTSLYLSASMFEDVEVEGEEVFKVRTKDLANVAKRASRNDIAEFELDRANRILTVRLRDKKTGVIRQFDIPVSLEVEGEVGEINLNYPVTFEVLASDFKEVLSDLKIVGDEVEISYSQGKIRFRSEGVGRGYEAFMEQDRPLIYLSANEEPVSSVYAVDLLAPTMKVASASSVVRVSFGENIPIQLKFDIKGQGTITYWLAPRT
uniref:DNA polymerase sliding clamp n=1 Tax=Fervidicoccus fontis TaxID=683846 RepID=A0A7C1E8W1_9CREN